MTFDKIEAISQAVTRLWLDLGETRVSFLKDPNNQRLRRHLILEFCSYMESRIYYLRQIVLFLVAALTKAALDSQHREPVNRLTQHFNISLSPEEIVLLKMITPDVRDNGVIRTSQRFIPLLYDIRFVFDCYARALRVNHTANYGTDGWRAVQSVVQKRNLLTHPKSIVDLEISGGDIDDLILATDWFTTESTDLMEKGNISLKSIRDITGEMK